MPADDLAKPDKVSSVIASDSEAIQALSLDCFVGPDGPHRNDTVFLNLEFSKQELAILRRRKALLLVSGGPDSVFIFHKFLHLKKYRGVEFHVVHFNHHLRGAESQRDQKFVEELCVRHGIICHIRHLHFEHKTGIQDRARRLRLEECRRLHIQHGYSCFVTAHHLDDVFETLVMKFVRGAGLKGLTGIRRWQEMAQGSSRLKFFRPLLEITKDELLGWLWQNKVAFCVDSSNLGGNYFRNRVRLALFGKGVLTSVKKRRMFKKYILPLQTLDDYFETCCGELLKQYPSFFPRAKWERWPDEVRFRYLRQKVKEKGFRQQFERKHWLNFILKDPVKITLGQCVLFKNALGCYVFSCQEWEEFRQQRQVLKRAGKSATALLRGITKGNNHPQNLSD